VFDNLGGVCLSICASKERGRCLTTLVGCVGALCV